MTRRPVVQQERTRRLAAAFLDEYRRDLERATAGGADLPPRLRSVHARPGHATPEYRTHAIPIPAGMGEASPEVLSGLIARYAALKPPVCLLLALEAVVQMGEADAGRVLIAEARDAAGTRLFYVQPFRAERKEVAWGEPDGGGWRDPGDDEMVLDAAFSPPAAAPLPDPAVAGGAEPAEGRSPSLPSPG